MKKIITLLLVGILLISCIGCKKAPEGGDYSDIAMSEDDDGVEMQAENIIEKNADVPKAETVQPKQTETKKEQEQYNLNYTVKHDDSFYTRGYTEENMPEFPIVNVVDSTQKLSQVVLEMSVGSNFVLQNIIEPTLNSKFPEKIRYREKTEATEYDYSKAKQEASVTEYYNDAFFENKILVIVISKLSDYRIIADLNSVKSDGNVQIDLITSKGFINRLCNYSCCEYIELDKKYAGLDFKVKYNEVSIDKNIDTRDRLPEYPQSIDFKAKQSIVRGCKTEAGIGCRHRTLTVITSVEELENYISTTTKDYNFFYGDIIDAHDYSNTSRIDFTSKTTRFHAQDYYNEEFFKNKIIVAYLYFKSSSDHGQVRSVTPDGIISEEYYVPSSNDNDMFYTFEFIELDKQYENAQFKIEYVKLKADEYSWNK